MAVQGWGERQERQHKIQLSTIHSVVSFTTVNLIEKLFPDEAPILF